MMMSATRTGIETDCASVARRFEVTISGGSEALKAFAAELDQSWMDVTTREIWRRSRNVMSRVVSVGLGVSFLHADMSFCRCRIKCRFFVQAAARGRLAGGGGAQLSVSRVSTPPEEFRHARS